MLASLRYRCLLGKYVDQLVHGYVDVGSACFILLDGFVCYSSSHSTWHHRYFNFLPYKYVWYVKISCLMEWISSSKLARHKELKGTSKKPKEIGSDIGQIGCQGGKYYFVVKLVVKYYCEGM